MNKRLACRMCAELELFDVAADLLRWFIRIKRHLATCASVTQKAGGRLRICVSHKEDRVLRVLNDSSREDVGERSRNHHAAGENVHASAAYRRIADCFIIQNKRRHFSHEFQARHLSPRGMWARVEILSNLRVEPADINWEFGQEPPPPKLVKHAENF